MLYLEKKSLLTELKERSLNIIWGVVLVVHIIAFVNSLDAADRHGWDKTELLKIWFLYGIFFVLCCILDTLKRLLRNSNGRV